MSVCYLPGSLPSQYGGARARAANIKPARASFPHKHNTTSRQNVYTSKHKYRGPSVAVQNQHTWPARRRSRRRRPSNTRRRRLVATAARVTRTLIAAAVTSCHVERCEIAANGDSACAPHTPQSRQRHSSRSSTGSTRSAPSACALAPAAAIRCVHGWQVCALRCRGIRRRRTTPELVLLPTHSRTRTPLQYRV